MGNFKVYEGLYYRDGGTVKYLVKGNDIWDSFGTTKIAEIDGNRIYKAGKNYNDWNFYEKDGNTIYYVTRDSRKAVLSMDDYNGRQVVRPYGKNFGYEYTLEPENSSNTNTYNEEYTNNTGNYLVGGGYKPIELPGILVVLIGIIALPLLFGIFYLMQQFSCLPGRLIAANQRTICHIAQIIYFFSMYFAFIKVHDNNSKAISGEGREAGFVVFGLVLIIFTSVLLFNIRLNVKIRNIMWECTTYRGVVSFMCYLLPTFIAIVPSFIYEIVARNVFLELTDETIEDFVLIIYFGTHILSAISVFMNNVATLDVDVGVRGITSVGLWLLMTVTPSLIVLNATDK